MLEEYLSKRFAINHKSSKNLIKGIISTTILDISLMLPMALYAIILYLILEEKTIPQLPIFLILILISSTIIFISQWIQYYYVYNTTYDSSIAKRISLAESIRLLPLSFFERKDLSDLSATIMGDCTDLEHVFSHAIPQITGSIISLILISIGLLIYNTELAISLLWVAPVSFTLLILSKKIQDKRGEEVINTEREVSNQLQEALDNIQEIKAYNYQNTYQEKLEKTNKTLQNKRIKGELVTGSLVSISQMILKLGIITVMLIGTIKYTQGTINLFTFLMFLIAGAIIYTPIETALMFLAEIFNADIKIKRMKNLEEKAQHKGKTKYQLENYNITFHNVSFAYKDKTVLKNINLKAKQGEITALVGPSGSGKSTISKLAANFQNPDKGKITIDTLDISTINNEKILENYSIVFQDVILFNNTIYENIKIGKKDATKEEILKAAKIAKCEEFIEKLPEKYETIIGENGTLLSGGERQRISIARAILKDAPIIILDEATSFLDVENETKIQEALNQLIKNKTVIIIAHRMRTIMNANKIIVLDEGEIKEEGTPEEVYKQGGIFKKMVDIQTETSQWKL